MKEKTISKKRALANIAGLGEGDRALCGPYGVVTCVKAASKTKTRRRVFAVSRTSLIRTRGRHTLRTLREAIMSARA